MTRSVSWKALASCALVAILAASSFVTEEAGRLVPGPWFRFMPSFAAFACGSIVMRNWLAACGFALALLELALLALLMDHLPVGCLLALVLAMGWLLCKRSAG